MLRNHSVLPALGLMIVGIYYLGNRLGWPLPSFLRHWDWVIAACGLLLTITGYRSRQHAAYLCGLMMLAFGLFKWLGAAVGLSQSWSSIALVIGLVLLFDAMHIRNWVIAFVSGLLIMTGLSYGPYPQLMQQLAALLKQALPWWPVLLIGTGAYFFLKQKS